MDYNLQNLLKKSLLSARTYRKVTTKYSLGQNLVKRALLSARTHREVTMDYNLGQNLHRLLLQNLLKKAEEHAYAHNVPKRTGWLIPISQELIDSEWGTEADVIEYIENYLNEPQAFVVCTEFGWIVQGVVWSEESIPNAPCYSLDNEDWYKDGKLMLDSPFDWYYNL